MCDSNLYALRSNHKQIHKSAAKGTATFKTRVPLSDSRAAMTVFTALCFRKLNYYKHVKLDRKRKKSNFTTPNRLH